jgi:hypothetical protein
MLIVEGKERLARIDLLAIAIWESRNNGTV